MHPHVVTVFDSGEDAELGSAGLVTGTPTYLAPERLAGARATPSTDLYTVGVILHETLT